MQSLDPNIDPTFPTEPLVLRFNLPTDHDPTEEQLPPSGIDTERRRRRNPDATSPLQVQAETQNKIEIRMFFLLALSSIQVVPPYTRLLKKKDPKVRSYIDRIYSKLSKTEYLIFRIYQYSLLSMLEYAHKQVSEYAKICPNMPKIS